jgi:hypothetical protein
MNIVGKTLVIINLVFALLVAGFLVIDLSTRTNWKNGFDKLKAELDISRANTQNAQETNKKLLDEKKSAEANLLAVQKKFEEFDKDARQKIKTAEDRARQESDRAAAEQFKSEKAAIENGRLNQEIKDLTALVKNRNQMIVDLQAEANKFRQDAVSNEQKAKSANERSLALLDKLRQKELEAVQRENKKSGSGAGSSPRNSSYENPPTVFVKGLVEKVDSTDPSLGIISIGSDHGLKDGQTLLVYRTSPPEYLGSMLLSDVRPHNAVGRMLPPMSGGQRKTLKIGDEVASRLRP